MDFLQRTHGQQRQAGRQRDRGGLRGFPESTVTRVASLSLLAGGAALFAVIGQRRRQN